MNNFRQAWRFLSSQISSTFNNPHLLNHPAAQPLGALQEAERVLGLASAQLNSYAILRDDELLVSRPEIRSVLRRVDPPLKTGTILEHLPLLSLLSAKMAGVSPRVPTLNWALEPGTGVLARHRLVSDLAALIPSLAIIRSRGVMIFDLADVTPETDTALLNCIDFLIERVNDKIAKLSTSAASADGSSAATTPILPNSNFLHGAIRLLDADHLELKLRTQIKMGYVGSASARWMERTDKISNFIGSLLASNLLVSEYDPSDPAIQSLTDFGYNLSAAWTVRRELDTFQDFLRSTSTAENDDRTKKYESRSANEPIQTTVIHTTLPLILFLERNPERAPKAFHTSDKRPYRKLFPDGSGTGQDCEWVSRSRALLEFYTSKALTALRSIQSESKAKTALIAITESLASF